MVQGMLSVFIDVPRKYPKYSKLTVIQYSDIQNSHPASKHSKENIPLFQNIIAMHIIIYKQLFNEFHWCNFWYQEQKLFLQYCELNFEQ